MEKRGEHLEYRISQMERSNEAINELKTAVEILAITNQNQNKQIEQQSKQFEIVSKSMEAVNKNLISLNSGQREMQMEVSRQGEKLEKMERVQENSTISIGELAKKVLVTFLVGIGVFTMGFMAYQYGVK